MHETKQLAATVHMSWLSLLGIVYDKCWGECITGFVLCNYSTCFPSGTFLLMALLQPFCFYGFCVWNGERETGRLTVPYEVSNVCLTHADADCVPVNRCGRQKIIQKQLRDGPYLWQLSLVFQSSKCDLENLSWAVWHAKARRYQRGKGTERGSACFFGARPSSLFWPVFQAMCYYHTTTVIQEQLYL